MLSIDWRISMAEASRRVGDRVALQGNLDPVLLLGAKERLIAKTAEILEAGRTARAHPESRTWHSSADAGGKRAGVHRIRQELSAPVMKVGVLLFNLGGPETLRDVKPFLYRLVLGS